MADLWALYVSELKEIKTRSACWGFELGTPWLCACTVGLATRPFNVSRHKLIRGYNKTLFLTRSPEMVTRWCGGLGDDVDDVRVVL